jgi:hypothetical protein
MPPVTPKSEAIASALISDPGHLLALGSARHREEPSSPDYEVAYPVAIQIHPHPVEVSGRWLQPSDALPSLNTLANTSCASIAI